MRDLHDSAFPVITKGDKRLSINISLSCNFVDDIHVPAESLQPDDNQEKSCIDFIRAATYCVNRPSAVKRVQKKNNKQTNKMKTKEKAYVKQCRLKPRTD